MLRARSGVAQIASDRPFPQHFPYKGAGAGVYRCCTLDHGEPGGQAPFLVLQSLLSTQPLVMMSKEASAQFDAVHNSIGQLDEEPVVGLGQAFLCRITRRKQRTGVGRGMLADSGTYTML